MGEGGRDHDAPLPTFGPRRGERDPGLRAIGGTRVLHAASQLLRAARGSLPRGAPAQQEPIGRRGELLAVDGFDPFDIAHVRSSCTLHALARRSWFRALV